MKVIKQYKILLLVLLLLFGGGGLYLSGVFTGAGSSLPEGVSHYTCPMHPQIHEDHPGQCPICHMDLVPVYKQGFGPEKEKESSSGEHVHGSTQTKSSRGEVSLSYERQQLIGLKRAVVEKKRFSREIHTSGRVAFDPELAVAIQEYLEVANRDPSLRRAAVSRLKLLGMGEDEIRQLSRRSSRYSNLYLPGRNDTVWVYADIYEQETSLIRPGQKARIYLSYGGGENFTGVVRSLSPTVDPRTRSIVARIEVSGTKGMLRPDTFVNVSLRIDRGISLVIPRSAVLFTGTRRIVFVIRDDSRFIPREVVTGVENEGEVEVLKGLKEGEVVAASATFLVDSESQLRSSVGEIQGESHD